MNPAEHAEVLPAPSVAVAWNVVEESLATLTVSPGEAKFAAEPVAAIALEHVLFVYSLAVEPASAEPMSLGLLSLAGEAGELDVIAGAAGAVESSTYVMLLVEHADVLPAPSVAVA